MTRKHRGWLFGFPFGEALILRVDFFSVYGLFHVQSLQMALLVLFFFHLRLLLQFTLLPLQVSSPCVCCISLNMYVSLKIVL